jgi:hypothetical protein
MYYHKTCIYKQKSVACTCFFFYFKSKQAHILLKKNRSDGVGRVQYNPKEMNKNSDNELTKRRNIIWNS